MKFLVFAFLNLYFASTLHGKTLTILSPTPLIGEIPETWRYQTSEQEENVIEFESLSLWQMQALLVVYDESYTWVQENEFNWLENVNSNQEFTWGWYNNDNSQYIVIAKEVSESVTALMMIGGSPNSIDDNYINIMVNLLRSLKPRELGPEFGSVSEETSQLAKLALQRTNSALGTSTRQNYWFCDDGSFRFDNVYLNSSSSLSSYKNYGRYEIENGILELYFNDGTRQSLPIGFTDNQISMSGLPYQIVPNEICP